MWLDHRNRRLTGKPVETISSHCTCFSLATSRIHGGKPIKPSKKYEIIEESPTTIKLIIHDVTPDDEGPIQIKVKNPLGESEATVQLKVLGTVLACCTIEVRSIARLF